MSEETSLEPSDTAPVTWPDRPTCHDGNYMAQRFGPASWREAKGETSFRTCSYCGSIHPEDLLNALRAGGKAGGSDWKYGWPHKFYIDGIPNTNQGNPVLRTSRSIEGPEPTEEERASMQRWADGYGGEMRVVEEDYTLPGGKKAYSLAVFVPDGPTTHGKWYNEHLKDLSPAALAELAPVLERHTGIHFEMRDGELMFIAPRAGYQR